MLLREFEDPEGGAVVRRVLDFKELAVGRSAFATKQIVGAVLFDGDGDAGLADRLVDLNDHRNVAGVDSGRNAHVDLENAFD